MEKFAYEYDFKHVTSSPYFAQSNGQAERSVQIAKKILEQADPAKALLVYRATPTQSTGYSPAELLMGRKIRTTLPVLPQTLDPSWPDLANVRENDSKQKEQYKYYYDRRHGARNLQPLVPGEPVNVRVDTDSNWNKTGVVIGPTPEPRSYLIQQDHGGVVRRNRCHLQPSPPADQDPARDDTPTPVQEVPPCTPLTQELPPPGTPTTRSGRVTKPAVRYGEWTK